MRNGILAVIALAALGGCGAQSEKAMNESFEKSFREGCTSSASKSGAPIEIVTKVCDCSIKAINAKYTVTQKLTLGNDELNPIMTQCVNSAIAGK